MNPNREIERFMQLYAVASMYLLLHEEVKDPTAAPFANYLAAQLCVAECPSMLRTGDYSFSPGMTIDVRDMVARMGRTFRHVNLVNMIFPTLNHREACRDLYIWLTSKIPLGYQEDM